MKRFRLRDLISGPAVKEFNATVLSGTSADLFFGSSINLWDDLYIGGVSGDILLDDNVIVDNTIYNSGWFERLYSIHHPNITTIDPVDLEMRATDSDILNSVQFGDYSFLLTNATSLGTRYSLESSNNLDVDDWWLEKHQVVTYVPGTSGDEIDIICSKINFNLTPESPDLVYGLVSGGELMLYTKATSGVDASTVYSMSGIPFSLPFNYLFEQPLNKNIGFAREGIVYGALSGLAEVVYVQDVNALDQLVYSPYADADDTNKIYVNPFKLKNMYDNNWQTNITRSDNSLFGARNYHKVGKTQETLWLSYNYHTEEALPLQNYQLVERVEGLYKYQPAEGHKSNIFSIRVTNSGLNEMLTDDDLREDVKNIIKESILKAVKKIAPASTQLWKIDWRGL